VLKHLDYLETENNVVIEIQAKPEPVLTVTASDRLTLLRAAYHLGNRHVPIEITPDYLRFSPDPVLQKMLQHLGLAIQAEIVPFFPEAGAYVHAH
jgi:urease accessory protein